MNLTAAQLLQLDDATGLSLDNLDEFCAKRMGWQIRTSNDRAGMIVNDPGGELVRDYPHPTRDRADSWELLHFAMQFLGPVVMEVDNDATRHVRIGGGYYDSVTMDRFTGIDRDPKIALCRAVVLRVLWLRFYEADKERQRRERTLQGE